MIQIPWYVTAFLALIVFNCIISFQKGKAANTIFITISSVLSVVGIVGMIAIRPYFIQRVTSSIESQNYDREFIDWAIQKFDAFAVLSVVGTCLVLAFYLLSFLRSRNRIGFVWRSSTPILVFLMVFHVIASVGYGIGTINKLFDVASFISLQAIAGMFVLYILMVIKRALIRKV